MTDTIDPHAEHRALTVQALDQALALAETLGRLQQLTELHALVSAGALHDIRPPRTGPVRPTDFEQWLSRTARLIAKQQGETV